MARKARNYRAEYAARIQRGLQRGLTRAQARGHGAERKGAIAASPRALNPGDVAGYVRKLRPDRTVKIVATLESGARREIGRGRPGPLLDYLEDADIEDRYSSDGIVAVQVIYS